MDLHPSRSAIEALVRQAVYGRLGREAPHVLAAAPNPLRVNVSARHCHLTREAVEALFGPGRELAPAKPLAQSGHFAAEETVTLIGPRSRIISGLRILGPCRDYNQVELAFTDGIALGFELPVRLSSDIAGTPGCMLMGPRGYFRMEQGLIRALRHAHMSPADAAFYGVAEGGNLKLRVGGDCPTVLEKVLVRVNPSFELEVHIDTDEANACNLVPGTPCELFR